VSASEFPLSDREYAFGWLVFGRGLSREESARLVATSMASVIDLWAGRQKTALRRFREILIEA